MFLQEMERIIGAFKRYLEYDNEVDDFYRIESYFQHATSQSGPVQTMWFHKGDYSLKAWVDENDELHVENHNLESVFDYDKENGWSDADVKYMKYGIRETGKTIHEDGSFTNNSWAKTVEPDPYFVDFDFSDEKEDSDEDQF